jgi:hypothetical protein
MNREISVTKSNNTPAGNAIILAIAIEIGAQIYAIIENIVATVKSGTEITFTIGDAQEIESKRVHITGNENTAAATEITIGSMILSKIPLKAKRSFLCFV